MMPRNMDSILLRTYGGTTPEDAIQTAVEQVLAAAETSEPPAPLDLLGSLRGVERIECVEMPSAGRLLPDSAGGYVIQVNGAHSFGRQRFSAAHEIVHTFFNEVRGTRSSHDDEVIGRFERSREDLREEYLCDIGAAHMLLHPHWLRVLALGREPSLERLFAAADRCGASAEATARQLAVLGIWECSFIIWEPGYRKGERDLLGRPALPGFEAIAPRPTLKLRAERVYPAPGAPFFPRRKSVGEDTSVAEALGRKVRTRGVERFEIGSSVVAAECESQYVGYRRSDGAVVDRVLTLVRWSQPG